MGIFSKKKKRVPEVKTKKQVILEYLSKYLFITIGAMIAAFALECFLLPNDIIDGGVIGISMMISYITKWNLGLIIFVINLPFIYLAIQKMGKTFVFNVFYGVTMLSIFVNVLSGFHVTEAQLLATVFGGVILGVGVGIILRNNDECKMVMDKIRSFINSKLHLELNDKSRYYPGDMGVNFCGYRIYEYFILVRNRCKKIMRNRIRKWNKIGKVNMLSLNSWLSHVKHVNSYRLVNRYIDRIKLVMR